MKRSPQWFIIAMPIYSCCNFTVCGSCSSGGSLYERRQSITQIDNSCQSCFSGVHLVFEVFLKFKKENLRKCRQCPISFYRLVSRFDPFQTKVAHFCFCLPHITRVFSQEQSLESLESPHSLAPLENGRFLLVSPHSGGSLESLEDHHF